MLGLLFGQLKKTNVNEAPKDGATVPAPVYPQEEDPVNEFEGNQRRMMICGRKMSHKRWKWAESCQ
eukprot:6082646-Ditylum_brightwellii.AAC.1